MFLMNLSSYWFKMLRIVLLLLFVLFKMDPFSKTQNYPYLIDYMNRIDMMMRTKSYWLVVLVYPLVHLRRVFWSMLILIVLDDLEEVHKHVFEQQIRKYGVI